MPTNLLILPLLAGFCFVHICHRYRFRAQRLDGYRLLLESAMAGVVFLFLSRVTVVAIKASPFGDYIRLGWFAFAPVPWLGTTAGSVFVAIGLSLAANHKPKLGLRSHLEQSLVRYRVFRPIRRWRKTQSRVNQVSLRRALHAEITRHGSALTRLLHYADREECLVSITLSSRKWYVGFVAESINLDPQEQYFRILPILSGYRDKDTLHPTRVVYYRQLYESADSIDAREFVLTIPIKDVQIASIFDENLYNDHFADGKRRKTPRGRTVGSRASRPRR
jgi:hypothetical protein